MSYTSTQSLKRRVFQAGLWSLAGYGLSLALRLGSNLIMTRLLAPEMFGVTAIAWTFMTGLALLSDLGLKQNIVQSRRGHEPAFLNTIWTMQIVRGFFVFVGAVFLCVALTAADRLEFFAVSSVYADPTLPPVVGAISLSAFISGFGSTKLLEASRTIRLGWITVLEILSQAVGLVCMLAWAFFDRSIWALVAGSLGSVLFGTILGHLILPGVSNRWHWDRSVVLEVTSFGKWILLSSILGFFVNCGDRLLLGGLVDSRVLGYYSIASLFVSSVDGVLAKIMGDVSFPAFSEIVRTRPESLKRHYYKFLVVVASIAYLVSGGLMAFGDSLVRLLYDSRYQSAGWMLQLLAATLIAIPFRLVSLSFLALGLPKVQSSIILLRLVSLLTATPAGFLINGYKGAVLGIVLSHFVTIPVAVLYSIRYRLFDLRNELYLLALIPVGYCLGQIASLALAHWKW